MRLWHRLRWGHWYSPISIILGDSDMTKLLPGSITPVHDVCRKCLFRDMVLDELDEQRRGGARFGE
jgi:hypothetical protein